MGEPQLQPKAEAHESSHVASEVFCLQAHTVLPSPAVATHPVPDACDVLNAQGLGWGAIGIPLMEVVAVAGVAPSQVNGPGVTARGSEDREQWHVHHQAIGHCGEGDGGHAGMGRRGRGAPRVVAWKANT